jgi:hypothetical protein
LKKVIFLEKNTQLIILKKDNEQVYFTELNGNKAEEISERNPNQDLCPYTFWVDASPMSRWSDNQYQVVLFSLCGLPSELRQQSSSWIFSGLIPYLSSNFLKMYFSFFNCICRKKNQKRIKKTSFFIEIGDKTVIFCSRNRVNKSFSSKK